MQSSSDYDSKNKISIDFFKTVQNKMHYATDGHTAAEVIFTRVDLEKDILEMLSKEVEELDK